MMAKHKKTVFQPSSTKVLKSSTAQTIPLEYAWFVLWAANLLVSTTDPKVLDKIFYILSIAKKLVICIVVILCVYYACSSHSVSKTKCTILAKE